MFSPVYGIYSIREMSLEYYLRYSRKIGGKQQNFKIYVVRVNIIQRTQVNHFETNQQRGNRFACSRTAAFVAALQEKEIERAKTTIIIELVLSEFSDELAIKGLLSLTDIFVSLSFIPSRYSVRIIQGGEEAVSCQAASHGKRRDATLERHQVCPSSHLLTRSGPST